MLSLLRLVLPVGCIGVLCLLSLGVIFQGALLQGELPIVLISLLVFIVTLAWLWDRKWLATQPLQSRLFYLFGLLIPLSSMIGMEVTLCVGVCITGYAIMKDRRLFPWYGFACVLYLIVWGFSTLILELPNLHWFSRKEGWSPLLGVQSLLQLSFAVLLFVAFALFRIWSLIGDARIASTRGIIIGGLCGLTLSLIQALSSTHHIFERIIPEFPRQTLLWNSLGRSVGTFTDPNAYGIFCGLFIGLLLIARVEPPIKSPAWQRLFLPGMLLSFLGGGFSGSRTFFLFLGGFAASYLIISLIYSENGRTRSQHLALISASILILCALIFGIDMAAMVRVRETLVSLMQGDLSLIENRMYFSQLCFEAFRSFPVFGVGPLQFPIYVTSFSDKLQIPLGLWVDNTNNTYLGIVAEFGLVGLLILFLGFSSARIRFQQNLSLKLDYVRIAVAAYISFALILILGPHYLFPEVLLTFVLLLAMRLEIAEYRRMPLLMSILVVLAFTPATFLAAARSELGLFTWEIAPETGETFRWTQERFRTWILCSENENGEHSAALDLRNGSPRPQKIILQAQGGGERVVAVTSGERATARFECPAANHYRGLLIQGSVDSPFYPSTGQDRRRLGIQVFTGSPSSLVLAQEVDNDEEGE
jgi:O-antigen ligase